MPEREYVCIKQCYYLSHFWNPARKGIPADTLTTDKEDVPEEWFRLVGEKKPARKPRAKAKPKATPKPKPEDAATA